MESNSASISDLKNSLPGILTCTALKKESANSLCGPCPKCGGNDRFVFKTDTGKSWCRQCRPEKQSMDIIDFHCWLYGKQTKDLFAEYLPGNQKRLNNRFHHYKLGSPVKIYPYHDENGSILYNVCRFDKPEKDFRPCDPAGKWKVKGIKPVPYNLPAMAKVDTVFICEGEKDADTINNLGLTGTCKANWTGKWNHDFTAYFKGKTVYILQDADPAGKEKAQDAAQALSPDKSIKIKLLPPFSDQKGFDVTDWINAGHSKEELQRIINGVEWHKEIKPASDDRGRFKLIHISEIEFRAPDWLVKPLYEKDTLNMVFGDPGAAKSFYAIDIGCSVATGKDFHGLGVKQGPVVYIAGEGQNGLHRRFIAWGIRHKYNLNDFPVFFSMMPAGLCDPEQVVFVIDAIKQVSDDCGAPALIVIDTLARNFGPGDENSTKDMSAFISGADQIREQCKACLLLVHHTGHGDKSRGRGAMALKGALDAEYRLEKDELETVRVTNTKMKDFKPPAPMAFKIRTVELGIVDEDGKEVTSAVLDSIDFEAPIKPSNTGRGKWQAIALNAYQTLEIEHKERLERNGYEPGAARVLFSDWRNKCFDLEMSKQTFGNCKKSLLEQNIFKIEHGYIMRSI